MESRENDTKNKIVSIITVVRNGDATIGNCIESVIAQTYPLVEHIIVDGASTDNTINIIRKYDSKISFWISEPDTGIYNALNKAIRLTKGQYYIPLGCDDALLPTAVEDLVSEVEGFEVVMGKVQCIGYSGQMLKIHNHSAGTLIKVSSHYRLGFYDESYKIAADTKFLEIAKQAGLVKLIDKEVGKFVLGGVSSNYIKNIFEHARAMRESSSWGELRSYLWIFPRFIFALLKK